MTEDAAFYDHDGIDLNEIKASFEKNWEEGQFLRGASTITRRLEAALTKRRILEIYLNMIEWGDGIFGCEAAARAYFGKPCASLSADEAALLTGAIINPREHSPARPTRRLLRRQQIILKRMGIKETPPSNGTPPAPPFDSGPGATLGAG